MNLTLAPFHVISNPFLVETHIREHPYIVFFPQSSNTHHLPEVFLATEVVQSPCYKTEVSSSPAPGPQVGMDAAHIRSNMWASVERELREHQQPAILTWNLLWLCYRNTFDPLGKYFLSCWREISFSRKFPTCVFQCGVLFLSLLYDATLRHSYHLAAVFHKPVLANRPLTAES